MELIFVGTGSGKTSLKRYHSSILLNAAGKNILIDCGEGTSRALINAGVDFNSIDSIFITHFHADHFAGISSLVTQMKLTDRTGFLEIYAHTGSVDFLKTLLVNSLLFVETLGFELRVKGYGFDEEILLYNGIRIKGRKNSHLLKKTVPGKTVLEKYSDFLFNSASLLISCAGKNIFITSDIGSLEDLFLFEDERTDLVITEATHLYPAEIGMAFEKLKPEFLFITHINEDSEKSILEWHSGLKSEIRERIIICRDGLRFHL